MLSGRTGGAYDGMRGAYWYFVLDSHTKTELLTAQLTVTETATENAQLKEGECFLAYVHMGVGGVSLQLTVCLWVST
jgi:hypothetical protein